MTDIRPFRALRYDPERVDLSRVIAPPYDVVNDRERVAYWERDPHNAIRLELTREASVEAEPDYAEAAAALAAWRREGILRGDARPALYGLRQRFTVPDRGSMGQRDGFFALLRLEDYARGMVLPHERTLTAPKRDRLRLLRATRANLSSVLLLYEDREHELEALVAERAGRGRPVRDDAGVEHTLVPIQDPAAITAARAFLAKRPVVIADGHHRYETALTYRRERRTAENGAADAACDWVLAYFANAFAAGSLILPIHRVVRGGGRPLRSDWPDHLDGWRLRTVPVGEIEQIPGQLSEHLAPITSGHAFAADDGSGILRIFERPARAQELTIRVLHREVLARFGIDDDAVREGALAFPKSALEAAKQVRNGDGIIAFYLNPLSPAEIFRVTRAGERLPQKSTYFYPKLPTGLVFRLLEEETG